MSKNFYSLSILIALLCLQSLSHLEAQSCEFIEGVTDSDRVVCGFFFFVIYSIIYLTL